MRKWMPYLFIVGGFLAGAAFAQNAGSPARLRGKTDTVAADTLQLTLRNGNTASANYPPIRESFG